MLLIYTHDKAQFGCRLNLGKISRFPCVMNGRVTAGHTDWSTVASWVAGHNNERRWGRRRRIVPEVRTAGWFIFLSKEIILKHCILSLRTFFQFRDGRLSIRDFNGSAYGLLGILFVLPFLGHGASLPEQGWSSRDEGLKRNEFLS